MARYGFVRSWPIWKDVAMALLLVGITAALVAWASPAAADADALCRAGYADSKIDPLRSKLPFTGAPTFQQLADTDRADDAQQAALIELDRARIACANAQVKELADAPPAMLAAFDRAVKLEQVARADLFTGKLTFGEYNRQVQKIAADMDAELAAVERHEAQRRTSRAGAGRAAAAGVRQAIPTYNPFPKPLICTSTRRGTLVDTFCR